MRGKVIDFDHVIAEDRITPAYAGKSGESCAYVMLHWDHPRLCGEKLKPRRRIETNQGSPPPMRGKDHLQRDIFKRSGITPAYAGKSISSLCSYAFHKDHPRLCGEKPKMRVLQMPVTGSPPPMRGKALVCISYTACSRITPAYAGKSTSRSSCFAAFAGSPPPMRGKVRAAGKPQAEKGITPAYAGKSASTRSAGRRMQDHPRLCGEKDSTLDRVHYSIGSPPPMRGKATNLD